MVWISVYCRQLTTQNAICLHRISYDYKRRVYSATGAEEIGSVTVCSASSSSLFVVLVRFRRGSEPRFETRDAYFPVHAIAVCSVSSFREGVKA